MQNNLYFLFIFRIIVQGFIDLTLFLLFDRRIPRCLPCYIVQLKLFERGREGEKEKDSKRERER